MFTRILFPTDGSGGAAPGLDHAIDIAAEYDAELHLLNVADTTIDSVVGVRADIVDVLENEGEEIVDQAAERARRHGVDTVTEVVQGEPFRTIIEYAPARDIDLIVMPTHGRGGLPRVVLGSTTERVVRRSDVPVLTVQTGEDFSIEYPYQNVLVPTDGSDCARAALDVGIDVAKAEDASLHLRSVIDIASLGVDVRSDIQTTQLQETAETILEEASAVARDAGVDPGSDTVSATSIHKAILDVIEEQDIDLVVVGTHGRTGLDRYLLGSVTEYLIRTSPIPVLTVRQRDERS